MTKYKNRIDEGWLTQRPLCQGDANCFIQVTGSSEAPSCCLFFSDGKIVFHQHHTPCGTYVKAIGEAILSYLQQREDQRTICFFTTSKPFVTAATQTDHRDQTVRELARLCTKDRPPYAVDWISKADLSYWIRKCRNYKQLESSHE